MMNGDHQSGPAGAELPLPLTGKAVSPSGASLAVCVVNFRVTGGGSVYAGSALSDRPARAGDCWTLGPEPGVSQTLEVRAVTALGDEGSVRPVHRTSGILASGVAMCWGRNRPDDVYGGGGQLGDGATINRPVPTAVAEGLAFRALAVGESYTCGITVSGSAWYWGNNASGQLGDASNVNRLVPALVTGGLLFPTSGSGSLRAAMGQP